MKKMFNEWRRKVATYEPCGTCSSLSCSSSIIVITFMIIVTFLILNYYYHHHYCHNRHPQNCYHHYSLTQEQQQQQQWWILSPFDSNFLGWLTSLDPRLERRRLRLKPRPLLGPRTLLPVEKRRFVGSIQPNSPLISIWLRPTPQQWLETSEVWAGFPARNSRRSTTHLNGGICVKPTQTTSKPRSLLRRGEKSPCEQKPCVDRSWLPVAPLNWAAKWVLKF